MPLQTKLGVSKKLEPHSGVPGPAGKEHDQKMGCSDDRMQSKPEQLGPRIRNKLYGLCS
jgi:hypothetical protein